MRQLMKWSTRAARVSATLSIATLLLIGLLSLLIGRLPAQAAPAVPEVFGSLSGQVTDPQGNPLAGIRVELNERYGYRADYVAVTDASGHYRIGLILTGIYVVRFYDPTGRYATQFYPTAEREEQAADISISANTLTGIDTTLQVAGQISGMVTATGGLQLRQIEVSLYPQQPQVTSAYRQTLAPGEQRFQFSGLHAGIYGVCASAQTTDPHFYRFEECYDDYLGYPSAAQLTPITVSAGVTVSNINFIFGDYTNLVALHGVIRATDGQRLAGVNVVAWRWFGGWNREREEESDLDGTFQLAHLLPGLYAIGFDDPTRTYVFEQQSAGLQLQNVITVDLPLGGDQQVVTATLVPGAQITGIVTLQGEAFPSASDVILYAGDNSSGMYEVARTPIDPLTGHYHLRGLTSGTYQLYAEEYHNNARFAGYYGDDIGLARSEIKGNLNFTLYNDIDPYQGLITGTVTAQGQPLAGIKVQLHHETFDGPTPVAFTFTDAKGNYQLGGLSGTSYAVGFFDPKQVYAFIYYPNQRNPLSLDAFCTSMVCTNVNAELTLGGVIKGHIQQSTGGPVTKATIVAYWREDERWHTGFGYQTLVDERGDYQLPALVPDTYRLGIYAYVGHPTQEFYDNIASVETATDLVVRAGSVLQADVVIGPRQTISTAYLPLLQR